MTADDWPYASLRAAVKAEPNRVHLHIGAQANGKVWGKPIPCTISTFNGPRDGEFPIGFRVTYYCVGTQGATQLVLRVRVGPAVHEYDRMIEAHDIGYHAHEPTYEDQKPMDGPCHLLGGPCYYGGSSLWAEQVLGDKLIAAGPERWEAAAFEVVIDRYEEQFGVTINRETLTVSAAVSA